ncbi:hypothetical protein APHAL10511_007884 [Amanita phalloides]|nr:hypothetical protein APHAL10511_007884 [Amanita phalloides]
MSVPPLPKIDGDAHIILDVYSHSSLRNNNPGQFECTNDEYGDADRLALLGSKVLDLAITHHWYRKSPPIAAELLRVKQRESLSDKRLSDLISGYNLVRKLRYAPNAKVDANMCRAFLNTYVGALYIRNGLPVVQDFVSRLIDPDASPEDAEMMDTVLLNPKQQPPPPLTQPPPPPPPPDYTPLMKPQMNGYAHHGTSNAMNKGFLGGISLAVFNQVATQKGHAITWSAESTGPPHLPTWTVRCLINGVEKGRGTGRSQKVAKEDAARRAWILTRGLSI